VQKTILCILVITTALLAGCGDPESQHQETQKVYRHSMDNAPSSLDPAQAASIYATTLVVNLYDTLYRYKYLARPYELEPNLAAAMPTVSDDGLQITIPIKKGVYYIDDPAFEGGVGREVKAADFVYSIKRHFDPETRAQGAWLWQNRIVGLDEWKEAGSDYSQTVPGLQAIDDYSIQITLTQPFPQLIHTFTNGYAAIVPREAVEKYAQEFGNHPVGSGPFKLESRNSSRAVLAKNSNFRQQAFNLEREGYNPLTQGHLGLESLEGKSPPFVDVIQVEFIKEGAARWNAFSAGELDFIKVPILHFNDVLNGVDPITIRPEVAENYHFAATPASGFIYTNFNMANESIGYHPDELQNERNQALRCAMVKAFDWKKNNEVFFHSIGQVFPGVIPPVAPEFEADADQSYVQRDVDGAVALLKKYDWNSENLPELDYGFTNSSTERQAFEQFRQFMTDIGYPSEKIRPMTFASYGDYQRAYSLGKVTLMNSSWTMDYPDAENTMQLFYSPNAAPGSNTSNFKNAEYDRLYEETASLSQSPQRTAMFRTMNQIVMDECASITGIAVTQVFLWDKRVNMLPDRSFLGGYFMRFVDLSAGPNTTQ
jgi:ABC-type oligopeptide transport system substrate-binding subunit